MEKLNKQRDFGVISGETESEFEERKVQWKIKNS